MPWAAWGCLVCLVHREPHGYSCRARTCAGQGGIWVALIPKCVRVSSSHHAGIHSCGTFNVFKWGSLSSVWIQFHSVLKEKCDWTHRALQKTEACSDNKKIKSELRLDLVFLKWGPLCKTTVSLSPHAVVIHREHLTCDTSVELMWIWALCRLHCVYNSSCLSQFFL